MPQRRLRLTMMAGWLFADLFLVLFLIGLPSVPAKPSPRPSASQTHPSGLDPHRIDFNIDISPAAFRGGSQGRFVDAVNTELRRRNPDHRPVGFVLIFASGPVANAAQKTANDAFRLLHRQSADFADSTGLGYWTGSGDHFEFKIFLLR